MNKQRYCGASGDPVQVFRQAILDALDGYAPEHIEPGRSIRFATNNVRGDDAGWCFLFDDSRGGVFCDWRRGGNIETWSAVDPAVMTPRQRMDMAWKVAAAVVDRAKQQHQRWAYSEKKNVGLWAACKQVTEGDPVHRYLCHRLAIDEFNAPSCLRFHPALPYWHDGKCIGEYPAMVAQMLAPDGRPLALHRTYLTDAGLKAKVPTVKKLTPSSGTMAGGSIRLSSPRAGLLGVAEGIETALAASLASGVPTVAAYCGRMLAAFEWPASTRRLVIFADADDPGRQSADALLKRAHAARLACEIRTPTEGEDWCDVWAKREAGALA